MEHELPLSTAWYILNIICVGDLAAYKYVSIFDVCKEKFVVYEDVCICSICTIRSLTYQPHDDATTMKELKLLRRETVTREPACSSNEYLSVERKRWALSSRSISCNEA